MTTSIAPGVVQSATFAAFRQALGSSNGVTQGSADFEKAALKLGDERMLNGPQGAFACTLVGADSETFGDSVVAAPPPVASKEYATELVELYWASLLRDVPFTEYATNEVAKAATNELSGMPARKFFAGEADGPQISQFCIQPTNLGTQEIDQKMTNLAPNADYMTNFDTWQAVQNGVNPSFRRRWMTIAARCTTGASWGHSPGRTS